MGRHSICGVRSGEELSVVRRPPKLYIPKHSWLFRTCGEYRTALGVDGVWRGCGWGFVEVIV